MLIHRVRTGYSVAYVNTWQPAKIPPPPAISPNIYYYCVWLILKKRAHAISRKHHLQTFNLWFEKNIYMNVLLQFFWGCGLLPTVLQKFSFCKNFEADLLRLCSLLIQTKLMICRVSWVLCWKAKRKILWTNKKYDADKETSCLLDSKHVSGFRYLLHFAVNCARKKSSLFFWSSLFVMPVSNL